MHVEAKNIDGVELSSVAIGISFQIPLDQQGKTIVMQTGLPQTADRKDINQLVDKMGAVAQRQADVVIARQLELDIETLKKQISDAEHDLMMIDRRHNDEWDRGKRQGPLKLTASQQQNRATSEQHIQRGRDNLAYKKALLEATRARIEGDKY